MCSSRSDSSTCGTCSQRLEMWGPVASPNILRIAQGFLAVLPQSVPSVLKPVCMEVCLHFKACLMLGPGLSTLPCGTGVHPNKWQGSCGSVSCVAQVLGRGGCLHGRSASLSDSCISPCGALSGTPPHAQRLGGLCVSSPMRHRGPRGIFQCGAGWQSQSRTVPLVAWRTGIGLTVVTVLIMPVCLGWLCPPRRAWVSSLVSQQARL